MRRSQIEIVRDYGEGLPQVHGIRSTTAGLSTNLILNARDSLANGTGRITLAPRNGDDDDLLLK